MDTRKNLVRVRNVFQWDWSDEDRSWISDFAYVRLLHHFGRRLLLSEGDPLFVRKVKRWERKESGEKVLIEKPLRNSKWWQPDQNGGFVMTVKVGAKRIEFEKGKAAIVVPSIDKLPTVIDTLIKAVRAGELDEQLKSSKGPRPLPSRKVA